MVNLRVNGPPGFYAREAMFPYLALPLGALADKEELSL